MRDDRGNHGGGPHLVPTDPPPAISPYLEWLIIFMVLAAISVWGYGIFHLIHGELRSAIQWIGGGVAAFFVVFFITQRNVSLRRQRMRIR